MSSISSQESEDFLSDSSERGCVRSHSARLPHIADELSRDIGPESRSSTTFDSCRQPDLFPEESPGSTSSAEDSHARISRSRVAVGVLKAPAAVYGLSSLESWAKFDRDSRSWKTSGLFLDGDSIAFSETLPRSGMVCSGTLYRLPQLARIIYATGYGLSPSTIPTPTAQDCEASGSRNRPGSAAKPGISLTDWARSDGGMGRLIPTPQASDWKNCSDYSSGSRKKSPQLRHLGNGRLNPRFVEWLMMFPRDWTVPEPRHSGTRSSQSFPNCSDAQS